MARLLRPAIELEPSVSPKSHLWRVLSVEAAAARSPSRGALPFATGLSDDSVRHPRIYIYCMVSASNVGQKVKHDMPKTRHRDIYRYIVASSMLVQYVDADVCQRARNIDTSSARRHRSFACFLATVGSLSRCSRSQPSAVQPCRLAGCGLGMHIRSINELRGNVFVVCHLCEC